MDDALSAALQRWVGDVIHHEGPFTLVPLPSRSANRVFRIEVEASSVQYVLKLVAPGRVNALAHERAITDYLAARGFPVAPILAATEIAADHGRGQSETATLRIAVPGVPLSEVLAAASDTDRDAFIDVLATLLARVHRLPLDEVRDLWQYPEDRVDAPADWATNFVQKKIASDLARITDALPEEVRDPFTHEITAWGQWLTTASVPLAPLHGDYYGDNVLIAHHTVTGVLDWEAARLGDPMWDLARSEAVAFADVPGAPDAFARFLKVYAEHVPWAVDAHRIRRYRLLMAIGDLRYAVRHAPALISARIPVVVALWQQCRERD